MNSSAFNNTIDNDLMDIFNSSEMEIQELDNLEDLKIPLTDLLANQIDNEEKIKQIHNLVTEFLPKLKVCEIDEKIFKHLMPFINGLILTLFEEIEQSVDANQPKSNETLKFLKEHLKACINIHELLHTLINSVLQTEKISLVQVPNLPLNVIQILLITFTNCKKSNKLLKVYFEDLKEVIMLFKEAQNVHASFLQFLENNLTVNELEKQEFLLFKNILETLGVVGITLTDMNVKSITDNWKCYVNLTQKYTSSLNNVSFNVKEVFNFLLSESIKKLSSIKTVNQKGAISFLKLGNFFIRIAIRLCDIFWTNLENFYKDVFGFLTSLFDFSQPVLQLQGCCETVINQINSLIFVQTDLLLDKLLCEPNFYKAFALFEGINSTGSLFLILVVFKKLSVLINAQSSVLNRCDIHILITFLFDVIKECYTPLFWNIGLPICNQTHSLYDAIVISCSSVILSMNQNQYTMVEAILFKNCLQPFPWPSLLAIDVWCTILRQKLYLCYETLCSILEKTNSLLQNNIFAQKPEVILLEQLLCRLYKILADDQKYNFVHKYPPHLNLHIWKALGLQKFPKSELCNIESMLITVIEKMNEFLSGRTTKNDTVFLCHSLDLFASLPQNSGINLKPFLQCVIKFWNFDVAKQSSTSIIFKQILFSLCRVTKNFSSHFESAQTLLILTKLKELISCNFDIKIQAVQLIASFSNKSFLLYQDRNQILTELSVLFRILILDKNVVVQQQALDTFVNFLNSTPHPEIAQNGVKNNTYLKNIISNYIHRVVENGSMGMEEYLNCQKNYKFEHICIDEAVPSKPKRFNNSEDVNVVAKRIKSDIELLNTLCGKENSLQRNLTPIYDMLSQNFNLKF